MKLSNNQHGFSHHFLLPLFVIVAVAGVGTYVLQRGRAATNPYDDAGLVELKKKEDPKRGLVYKQDLRKVKKNANHPCQGQFEIQRKNPKEPILCTHGPDPAPQGADITKTRSELDVERVAKPLSKEGSVSQPFAVQAAAATVSGTNPYAPIAPKCYGDGHDGHRVQLVYAYVSKDNFANYQPYLRMFAGAADMAVVYSSVHSGTGSTGRHIRFEQDPKTCQPTFLKVRMPKYDSNDSTINNFKTAAPLTQYVTTRSYLIFMDVGGECGLGTSFGDKNPYGPLNESNNNVEYAAVGRDCWHYAETHELFHNFGAVSDWAPHTTGAGHCYDGYDIMCYDDGGHNFQGSTWYGNNSCPGVTARWQLDCGKNDYFSTASPISSTNYLKNNWNTANSPYLGL